MHNSNAEITTIQTRLEISLFMFIHRIDLQFPNGFERHVIMDIRWVDSRKTIPIATNCDRIVSNMKYALPHNSYTTI